MRTFSRSCFSLATALAIAAAAQTLPASAQQAPQAGGDPREAVSLSAGEIENLLRGMRTYLETIQGITAAMAENDTKRVPAIAKNSGAKLLGQAGPLTGLKLPTAFASMAFDTHDKFDKLANLAAKGGSRSEILTAMRDIMGNCIACHQAYRLAP